MNIFVLNLDPVIAAQEQCNAHVVKMIVESAQMLSTAHRVLDGKLVYDLSAKGRKITRYVLEEHGDLFYKSVHVNHPSTVWTRESIENYNWHYKHFVALCKEYTYRYGKIHATEARLLELLATPPKNIPNGQLTPFKLAMKANPECIKECPVESYQRYYATKVDRFKMIWSNRQVPAWFIKYVGENEISRIENSFGVPRELLGTNVH
jgi:hypothetical protein